MVVYTHCTGTYGNSKHGKAFFPTLPSSGKGPKEVVSKVSSAVGGVRNALDACELPRNEQQVSFVKQ